MQLFVCRGTGTWGPRMRLWQRGEIALITLRSPVSLHKARLAEERSSGKEQL